MYVCAPDDMHVVKIAGQVYLQQISIVNLCFSPLWYSIRMDELLQYTTVLQLQQMLYMAGWELPTTGEPDRTRPCPNWGLDGGDIYMHAPRYKAPSHEPCSSFPVL